MNLRTNIFLSVVFICSKAQKYIRDEKYLDLNYDFLFAFGSPQLETDFSDFTMTDNQRNYVQSLENHDINCILDKSACPLNSQRVRREMRTVSDEERNRIFHTIRKLKYEHLVDGVSKYDLIEYQHKTSRSPAAHMGPAFLGWHREYMRQFEIALRLEDPTLNLAYWDQTLDADLPDPRDSVTWGPELMGNGNGFVVTGPFGYWPAVQRMIGFPGIKSLNRALGANGTSPLLSHRDIDWMMNLKNYSDLTFCDRPEFYLKHGYAHWWIEGYMPRTPEVVNDPIFFFFHPYIDYIFERFRQEVQTADERVRDYGSIHNEQNCPRPLFTQAFDFPMLPFIGLKNSDGLSESYTKYLYSYDSPPEKCSANADCRSKFLFCNLHISRCQSKIIAGGNCTNLAYPIDACYKSTCRNSICVLQAAPRYTQRAIKLPKTKVIVQVRQEAINGAEYPVTVKATGISYRGATVTQSKLQYGSTEHNVIASISMSEAISMVRINAYDSFGRVCAAHCPSTNATKDGYRACDGTVTLKRKPLPIKRSRSKTKIKVNDKSTPIMIFICAHPVLMRDAVVYLY